jgi:hypothetical protein
MTSVSVRIEVEVSQDQGIEIPQTFPLGVDRIKVVEVLDQWYGPDYRYCKVKGATSMITERLLMFGDRVLASVLVQWTNYPAL